ncbi:MAG: hypothetical protein HDT44_02900 [Ruminococcaceae bacterium]|nr:hypothetical protein [Oscillospiraceae bacterium]
MKAFALFSVYNGCNADKRTSCYRGNPTKGNMYDMKPYPRNQNQSSKCHYSMCGFLLSLFELRKCRKKRIERRTML